MIVNNDMVLVPECEPLPDFYPLVVLFCRYQIQLNSKSEIQERAETKVMM